MKRRDFVIKSTMASLALASSSSIFGKLKPVSNANDTINIGVIGTGSRGSGMIPFINEIPNLKTIACCDILPSHLEEGLKRAEGNTKGYSDYRKMLENKDIDAIYMATPFHTHSQIGKASLEAGKHLYGEKTMAKGYEGIRDLIAAKPANLVYQTGHQYHSSRLYSHVVDLIKNGKVGQISSFECQWNRFGDWRRPVPRPDLERLINWRMYREYSGGLVAELCSHQIDFVNWVLEATPLQVMGSGGIDYWKDGRETYDNIHLIYNYPNGVEAKFTCLTTNAKDDYQIKVIGSKGTIILDYTKAWFYPEGHYNRKRGEVDGVSGATVQWEEGKGIPIHVNHVDPSQQALMDFRDSILESKTPLSNAITGGRTAIAVQMALDAMYNNKIVKWQPEFRKILKS